MDKPSINAVLEHYGAFTSDRFRYMTNCPFHDDRTPSMSVNTNSDLWNCKSCGQGGDSFSLIMKMETVDFKRAGEIAASLGFEASEHGQDTDEVSGSTYGGRGRGVARATGHRSSGGGYVPSWRRP